MLQGDTGTMKSQITNNWLSLIGLTKKRWAGARGSADPGWGCNGENFFLHTELALCGRFLFRIIPLLHDESRASMPHIQTAHPKDNVLGDVGGVVRDALEISRRQHELHVRRRVRWFRDHSREQMLENLVSITV